LFGNRTVGCPSSAPAVAPAARRARFVSGLALMGVSAAMTMTLTGCSIQDAVCGDGEYPVLVVGSTGSSCVPHNEEPPAGHARYPAGKVPEHVDDKWWVYWNTHTLDKNGKIIKAPEAG